jgi:hypothetical protein
MLAVVGVRRGDAQHDESGGIPNLQADYEICEFNICRA